MRTFIALVALFAIAAPAAAQTAAPAPADSILSAACSGARAGTVATGLVVVQFRSDVTDAERAAALKEAGGAAVGPAPDGGVYVRVASDSTTARDMADLLALNPAVAAVAERSCPAGTR